MTLGSEGLPSQPPDLPSDHLPGLYLHIPFCSAICPYCDFAVRRGSVAQRQKFAQALIHEIASFDQLALDEAFRAELENLRGQVFDTVYFGGGTPSYLGAELLSDVFAAIETAFRLASETAWFLEANPEDISAEATQAWHDLGVRTLSLGIQSFDDQELKFLGRRHSSEQAKRAVAQAKAAGFDTVSVDLIYGLPGQDLTSWQRVLDAALELEPDHLSCYELEIHAATPFGRQAKRGRLTTAHEDVRGELFLFTHSYLAEAGFDGYEVSNFARGPEHRSRHNGKYWQHTPYLGLGPSAHSYLAGRRWWNERAEPIWRRHLDAGRSPIADSEALAPADQALESLMLGLRTRAGIDLARFHRRWGIDLAGQNQDRLAAWLQGGYLNLEDGHLRPTLEGLAVADRLAAEIKL